MGYVQGTEWTDELIADEITKVKNTLNLHRMPSNSEIKKVVGYGLCNAVSRHGGYRYWAKKLSLNTKVSDTSLGQEYEEYVMNLIKNKGYEVERMSVKHPYDLLANQNIKIDVKVSNLYKGTKGKFHTFNLEKHNHNCDLFICICITDEKIVKTLVIPSKFLMGVSQLSVGKKSIYDVFEDRYDYIEKYSIFYDNLEC